MRGGALLYDESVASTARVHARRGACRGTPVAQSRGTTKEGCVAFAIKNGAKYAAFAASTQECRAYAGDCAHIADGTDHFAVYVPNSARLPGPGDYELVYTAADVNGKRIGHVVHLHVEDQLAPEWSGCPDNVVVEIEADEVEGAADWTPPRVSADNCLAVRAAPDPVEGNGHAPGRKFPVGIHPMSYALVDAFGNVAPEECSFNVIVRRKAHPVNLTCPGDQELRTLERAGFGIARWPAPTATQGGVPLPASAITYAAGVRPGLPFPYGSTTVVARAQGLITGNRTREEEQADECSFQVTVVDPERPFVDGRHFRCGAADGVEPYGVCAGTDVRVRLHEGYVDTGRYDLLGVDRLSGATACCADEEGTAHVCAGDGGLEFKFCVPAAALV